MKGAKKKRSDARRRKKVRISPARLRKRASPDLPASGKKKKRKQLIKEKRNQAREEKSRFASEREYKRSKKGRLILLNVEGKDRALRFGRKKKATKQSPTGKKK